MRSKISPWGNSAGIRLPKETLEAAGLEVGQEVELAARSGVVEVRLPTRRLTVEELFAEAEKLGPLEAPPTVDWGPDVGSEILPDEDWSDIAPSDAEMGIEHAAPRRRSSRRR